MRYIRPHFRDCSQWREENLIMSTTCDSAVKLYDSAIQQLMTFSDDEQLGGLMGTISKMLESDPNFVMGKVMKTGLDTFEANARLSQDIKMDINELKDIQKNRHLNEWERMHCDAVIEMGMGNRHKASQIWEEILMIYPKDLLALKYSRINHIYMGNSVMLRDTLARILPYWKRSDPEYGYLLNLYAFGLEETNFFEAAEKNVLDGLSLAPEDSWGVHTAAHVYESTSQYQKSGKMLLSTEDWWSKGGFACHNYWHLSNYYVEGNSFDKALEIFDEHVQPLFKKNRTGFSIDDGCQLLQKLEFEGVNVGDRWEDVREAYSAYVPANFHCYHDVFRILSFPRSDEDDEKKTFIKSAEEYVISINDDNSKTTQEVGLNVMKGVAAYLDGCFDDAVDYLCPVKHQFIRLGGSHAQREIFDLLLINSCLNSKLLKNIKIGRCLLHERESLKPDSPMTERLLNRLLAVHSEN